MILVNEGEYEQNTNLNTLNARVSSPYCIVSCVTSHTKANCTTVLRGGGGISLMVTMETTGCIKARSTEGKA